MLERAIIAGGGPIAGRVATTLGDYGYDPIVIEQDTDRNEQFQDAHCAVVINGDARRSDIIDQADPERADIFAALTGSFERNDALCRYVKRQTDTIRTVAKGPGPENQQDITRAADETVHIPAAGAKSVVSAMLGYDQEVCSVPTSGFDLFKLNVDPRAPAAGQRLGDVALPLGSHVVADIEAMEVGRPRTELRPDRQYLVAAEPTAANTVRNLLRGPR
jgi:K+ transport systems, NAD-binding component